MALAIAPESSPIAVDARGVARVGGTRLTLDIVIGAYKLGDSPEKIARSYDALTLADVYGAITYYLLHTADIDEYLRGRRARADQSRRMTESRVDRVAIHERLMKRATERGLL